MKAFTGAAKLYTIAPLAHQQSESKPFNPPFIFIPKLSVSSLPPFSFSAIRKWSCSHYSFRRKEFKIKAKVRAEADKDNEKKLVRVKILLQKECMFGEKFSVVGTGEGLGSWDPQAAIPMNWSPGHLWTTPLLDIPVGKRIYFKFILTDKLGGIEWQPGPDRIFETWKTTATIVVLEDWDSFDPQTITEEATEGEFAEAIAETEEPIHHEEEEGGGGREVNSGVPVLVPGLTRAFHADCSVEENVGSNRNSLASVTVAELDAAKEEDEEEENSSYVEDAVAEVLVPSTDEEGGGGREVNSGVPVLVPGLTRAFHADCSVEENVGSNRNSLASVMVAELDAAKEEDEEEENSSYVEDAVDTPTNHRSFVHEEEEASSSAEISVDDEEEASTVTELIENGDHAASSEPNCNEGELLSSGNGQPDWRGERYKGNCSKEERVVSICDENCLGPLKSGIRQGIISCISVGLSIFLLFSTYAINFLVRAQLDEQGNMDTMQMERVALDILQRLHLLTM